MTGNRQTFSTLRWLSPAIVAEIFAIAVFSAALSGVAVAAPPTIAVDRLRADDQTPSFQFPTAPAPIKNDAASGANAESAASWKSWGGGVDPNSGGLKKLADGKLPTGEDEPAENFFFDTRGSGGRIMVDLGRVVPLQQVNSYSWHPDERSDQVFKLYGSVGEGVDFDAEPAANADPATAGYELLATVDTTRDQIAPPGNAARRDGARGEGVRGSDAGGDDRGGQVCVEVGSLAEPLGGYRYLLFDVSQTDPGSQFSNTFYSEIDTVEVGTEGVPAAEQKITEIREYTFGDGKYSITIDTTDTPDLTEWSEREMLPEIKQWYPKIVAMLPSDGFEAPTSMKLVFDDSYNGVAVTSGTRIVCSPTWFRRQLQREAKGAIVHELVHVVQQYTFWRRGGGRYRVPTWVTEGIADYIRWRKYEPAEQRGGVGGRSPAQMRYNASYRETASFFNWVIENGHPDFLAKLNAAIRDKTYGDDFWVNATGESVEDLAKKWSESGQS